MRTVLLKSKVGPVLFQHRPTKFEKLVFDFSFENDFRSQVPADLWESLKEKFLDARTGLKYKEAFREL